MANKEDIKDIEEENKEKEISNDVITKTSTAADDINAADDNDIYDDDYDTYNKDHKEKEQKETKNEKKGFIKYIDKVFAILIIACIIFFVANKLFVFYAAVDGASMEPTYHSGEIVNPTSISKITDIKRGDVILFYPKTRIIGQIYIKRVVAIPGDTIQIIDGKLYVNDKEVNSSFPDMMTSGIAEDKITLDDHSFFVLGDNRNNSNDSRNIGPIPFNHIIGIVKQ